MSEVVIESVSKHFGETTAVDNLSLTIANGEFVVLLGPTGAGKTTILRLVSGLEQVDGGRISIGGVDMTAEPPATRDVTFVFQQYSLYPSMTVFDNMAFPLRSPARRIPEGEVRERVEEIARLLHIEDKLKNKATQLSGGEMQRVAIGRALVRRPTVYLMDEPLSSLDAKLRTEFRLELKRIQRDLGATILYVTHDQTEAMTLADRIGVILEGKLVQIGSPRAVYEQPENVYVASRLGSPRINLLATDTEGIAGQPPGAATVGARTEHIEIAKAANGKIQGRIEWIEHLGDQNHLHLTMGDHKLVTLADPGTGLTEGDAVSIKLNGPLYFDGEGRRIGK